MSKSRTTITDIARALQVTPSTVSRALQDHPRISQATKKAVLEMARTLNYQPNHLASALRSGRSRLLGVIVPTANRAFFSDVISGVEDIANQAQYSVLICQSHDSYAKEKENIEVLLHSQVAGILASVAKETTDYQHFQRVIDRGVPLVLYDRAIDSLNINSVVIDDRLGAYQAVMHLAEQGCRRIAHFTGPQHLNIYRHRREGYQAALQDAGLPYDEALVWQGNLTLETGRAAAAELWRLPQPPDAIFSASDFAAMGAMQWFKGQGMAIPGQVAVVGFANEPFTSLVEPGLSSVQQFSQEMGRKAARACLEQLESETPQDAVFQRITLNPRLIPRGSSLRSNDSSRA